MKKSNNLFKNKSIEKKVRSKRFWRTKRKPRPPHVKERLGREKNTLFMPESIGLHQSRDETLRIVSRIRGMADTEAGTLVLDFTRTTRVIADGMILVLAAIDMVVNKTKRTCVRIKNVRSDKVAQVIKQIGLSEKLGVLKDVTVNRNDVNFWHHVSRSEVDAESAADHFDRLCRETPMSEDDRWFLFNAFSEAIDNAHSHAYDSRMISEIGAEGSFPDDKRWWMFSGVDAGYLIVLVCDLGLGIPTTVTRKGWWEPVREKILARFGAEDEGKIVAATIEHARSRTGESYRGKGMSRLKMAIEQMGRGRLLIYSNKGCYSFGPEGEKTGVPSVETTKDYSASINGTVVFWQVPIQSIAA